MKTLLKEEIIENSQKWGMKSAEQLGARLIEKAHKYEAAGTKKPFNLLVITTPLYEVQLNYVGADTFSVLDTCDAYTKEPHGYPKTYSGEPQALIEDILSEIWWIDTIHTNSQE